MPGRRWHRPVLGLTALLLAACVLPPTPPGSSSRTAGGILRAPTLGKTVSAPSPSPAASPRPTGTPQSAQPTQTPASARPALSTANTALLPAIEKKLLAIAKVSFTQARSGLISNNGGGIVSNNGSGVISNNGGGLVSNNGSSYRLAQTTESVTLALEPKTGEVIFARRHWPDGTKTLIFAEDITDTDRYTRNVELLASGQPVEEMIRRLTERYAGGAPKRQTYQHTVLDAQGKLRSFLDYEMVKAEDDKMLTLTINEAANSRVREPGTDVAMDLQRYAVDIAAGTGSFRYHFGHLGLTESGTLSGVKLTSGGQLAVSTSDPLTFFDGASRAEDGTGALVYQKTQTTVAGKKHREYDLGDGLKAALVRPDAGKMRFEGSLTHESRDVATTVLEVSDDGSTVFTLTFPEAPEAPMRIGYGTLTTASPSPTPTATPGWKVISVAGSATKGFADGPGTSARFDGLCNIVASRVTPGKFYVADAGNHRVRVVTLGTTGSVTVSTLAGDGTAGYRDGAGAQAHFNRPFGLAAGPDDTLYVTEELGYRVRKIAPDRTVSTLAGTGTAGFADGPGASAQFNGTYGIALKADGTLLLADYNNHRIRQVAADGTVSTFLGDGTAGRVDGPVTGARIDRPLGVAVDATGNVYIADRGNLVIRRATPQGVVSTVAGSGVTARAFQDGAPAEGGINPPIAIALGPDGMPYFTHFDVRYLTSAGEVRTLAGGIAMGSKDGTNKQALFGRMWGLSIMPGGAALLSDETWLRLVVPPETP